MPTAVGSIPLAASVAGDQFDPNLANNQTSDRFRSLPSVNLVRQPCAPVPDVLTGQDLTFTATVDNTGPESRDQRRLELAALERPRLRLVRRPAREPSGSERVRVVAQLG